MIHRQEKRSLFGFSVLRHIDLKDAQTIAGGLVLSAMQIARALEARRATGMSDAAKMWLDAP